MSYKIRISRRGIEAVKLLIEIAIIIGVIIVLVQRNS